MLKTLEEPGGRVCLILAADELSEPPADRWSAAARALRLGPLSTDEMLACWPRAGVADAPRAAALARLAGRRPGAALALAGQPDVVIVYARLSRSLLDLVAAPARVRLAAAPALLEDGLVLATLNPVHVADDEAPAGQRGAPAQRRAAVGQLLGVWRELARDLALSAHGAKAELRQPELLDDLRAVAGTVEPAELTGFVGRLDLSISALEMYANPDLLLDTLLLAWPRPQTAGAESAAA